MDLMDKQKDFHDKLYAEGTRAHFLLNDPLVDYVTHWRLREAFRRLAAAAARRITENSRILVLCAGEGAEGSVLCDLGYQDVTISDISEGGVAAALARDPRLKGIVLNALNPAVEDNAFEVVLIQDGLHHLPSPVLGFTEMLRIASFGVVFLEPHDTLVGRLAGTRWEKNDDAVNYVFRWTRTLVQDVACSYLGAESFRNLSFSFWHHNIQYHRLGAKLGGGAASIRLIRALKFTLDHLLGRYGNQFCGLILKP